MANFVVTSNADALFDPSFPSRLTLQGALTEAQNTPGADTISFATNVERINWSAFTITDDVTIDGDHNDDGVPDVVLDANSGGRHFTIAANTAVTLEGLALVEGRAIAGTGGDATASVMNSGTLTLSDVHFASNYAAGGDGAEGGVGFSPSAPSKASARYLGADGRDGGDGGRGGNGGDAAILTNLDGTLILDDVVFDDTNGTRAGTGGRGGSGGRGANGGEGADFSFPYDPTKGGNGGDGGDGGFQGYHGTGAYVAATGGVVTGTVIGIEDPADLTQTWGYSSAPGGSGGSGGLGGKVLGVRWGSGSAGSSGSSTTSNRGKLENKLELGSGINIEQVDAKFTLHVDEASVEEGDVLNFLVQRQSFDEGIYAVDWRVVFDDGVTDDDFEGATSGTLFFSQDGTDIATGSLTLSEDAMAEGQENVRIVLSNAISLNEPRSTAIDDSEGRFAIAASEGEPTSPPPPVAGGPTDGADVLTGTNAGETINGLRGADVISGLGGNDILLGANGFDVIAGNQGNDQIFGNRGNDVLWGNQGADLLKGGQGADQLRGNKGDDTLEGGRGFDVLGGGQGFDVLDGGFGNDTLTGGSMSDVFVFNTDGGRDVVTDFTDGVDILDIRGADFNDLTIVQSGSATQISVDALVVTLLDTNAGLITADDFQ